MSVAEQNKEALAQRISAGSVTIPARASNWDCVVCRFISWQGHWKAIGGLARGQNELESCRNDGQELDRR